MTSSLNAGFVGVFGLEAACKLFSLGPRKYFFDSWNRFDFVVASISLVGLGVDTGVGANAVRVLRVGRVFRLIRRAQALQVMFNCLITTLPSLWNISSLIFLVMFVFAILGTGRSWPCVRVRMLRSCVVDRVVLFYACPDLDMCVCAGMSFFGNYTDYDPHSSFATFPITLVTIMRIITQDSWETVLFISRAHSAYAPLYFISLMVLCGFVMVNLFMAVVVVRGAMSCAPRLRT